MCCAPGAGLDSMSGWVMELILLGKSEDDCKALFSLSWLNGWMWFCDGWDVLGRLEESWDI